ncbi:hypothetical protein GJAV_G00157020 [Gymnothorax javanicus]|nr:hypothetical protein GJAV_G00157020 [Gymnothorax javanicus]
MLLTAATHTPADELLPGVVVVYCFGILVIIVSVLGIYGSRKEKKWSLILYSIGASLLGITLVFIGLSAATSTEEILEDSAGDFNEKKPLDTADEDTQKLVEGMQEKWDCCGLDVGYQDWGEHIADSCRCPEMFHNSSKCIEVHHGSAYLTGESVYSEPCLPFFLNFMDTIVKICLGLFFGFGFLLILGAVMASALLCQMRRRMTPMPVSFTVHSNVPEYRELADTAESRNIS